MIGNLFATILSMSITASLVAILIISLRFIFTNKLPKIFSYALWAIVLMRLIAPFSITSTFSMFNIIPATQTLVTQSLQNTRTSNMESGSTLTQEKSLTKELNNKIDVSANVKAPKVSLLPIEILLLVISWIWFVVAIFLVSFSIYIYFRTANNFKESVLYKNEDLISFCRENLKLNRRIQIYISDKIHTPVVCGLIKTRIIIPSTIAQDCNELELRYIITHELIHIKRFDYITKPVAVLALCIHWFNPIIWLSFKLSQKDMEMSCDQKVIELCDEDIRSKYAESLIKLAVKQNTLLNGGLLGFGESNIKSRIKGIMKYKKPGFWAIIVATVVLITLGVVSLTNKDKIMEPNLSLTNKDKIVETKVALNPEKDKVFIKAEIMSPETFLKTYDLKVKETPEKSTMIVPKNWSVTLGEYPEGLFWDLANVFSKDVGLDLNLLKGSQVELWKYSIEGGLIELKGSNDFKYPSNAILLVKDNKVVGAWLAFNVWGIGPSVKNHDIGDITGLNYEDWVQKEGIFSNSRENKDLESLGPVEVLKAYFKAISDGDKVRAHACESPIEIQKALIMNVRGNGLYNAGYYEGNTVVDNINKAKPISFRLMNTTNGGEVVEIGERDEIEIEVTMDLQWKDTVFNTPDEKTSRFTVLKKYKNGWKLTGLGTGP